MFSNLIDKVGYRRCDNCQNESICKYKDDFDSVVNQANKIELKLDTPISIEVGCNKFKSVLVNNVREPYGWNNQ